MLNDIENNIESFKVDVLELDKFLTGTRVSYSFFQNEYPEVLLEFHKKERSEVESEGMKIFDDLNNNIEKYGSEIFKYCLISLIARIDAFLNDIALSTYLWKMPNLQEDVRGKIILKFSHSSFKSKLEHLRNEFNLTFTEIESKEPLITEIFSTRNIILHNNGIVNETYLKINPGSKLRAGSERSVDENYLKLAFVLAVIIAKSVLENVQKEFHRAQ
jgi:hypothetical protein